MLPENENNDNVDTFTLFGCWNKGKCDNTNVSDFTRVYKTLIKDTFNPDTYFILGDNQYPEKSSIKKDGIKIKTKKFIMDDMISGFQCLKELRKPTFVLLGNHDIIQNIAETDLIRTTSSEQPADCVILDLQQQFIKNTENQMTTPFQKGFGISMHHIFPKTGVAMLMIDSNIYDEKDEDLDCLKRKFENQKGLHENQKEEIGLFLDKNTVTDVFISMHHPLVTIKEKNEKNEKKEIKGGKGVSIIFLNELFFDLLSFIHSKRSESAKLNPLHIFTADSHYYLETTIVLNINSEKITIQQHIVGTGGAELDTDVFPYDNIPETTLLNANIPNLEIISYTPSTFIDNKNGYLNCSLSANDYTFDFIEALPLGIAGKKRLTRKRKRSKRNKRARYTHKTW
jgi:hypothetical protein